MESTLVVFKKSLPDLIKSCSSFFQVDVSIKLFGVKIFSFTWPPKNDLDASKLNENEK